MNQLDDLLEREEDDRAQLAKDDRLAADPDFARRAAENAEWLRTLGSTP